VLLPDPGSVAVSPTAQSGATGSAASTSPTVLGTAQAPPREASSWNALPLLSYARETGLAVGGFGVVYFRVGGAPAESRPSYVAAAAMVTTRLQVLVDVYPEIWWDDERWLVTAQVAYRRFPDYFFGVGNQTREADRELYTLHSVWARTDVRRKLWGGLFAGLRHEVQWHELLELGRAPLLTSGTVRGAEGGTRHGLGPTLVWDTRDNTLSATRGTYVQSSLLVFDGLLGSAWDYVRFTLDARQYVSLAPTHSLAFEAFLDVTGGDVPFHQLPMLGGVSRMRGYYEGQYRDRTYAMAQAEYRWMPAFWRVGFVAFVGVGDVWNRWRDARWDTVKVAAGLGIRYALNVPERIHVRLDVGFGPDTWGLYVNVLEAF
jgi:outer membrane protein assembly factor BamA